jgi:aspartate/methionine/tyrosine aminotransferase
MTIKGGSWGKNNQKGAIMKLADFKLERYFAQYEFKVQYLLCSSDCQSLTIGDLLTLEAGAAERFQQHWLGYTESPGSPTLRQEITRIYTSIAPDEVLVHSGAEEAIFLFMHAVLNPGDHVIVHSPCYQSLAEVARSLGSQVTAWAGREETGWALDLAELERLIRPNTRVIVVNMPHNPTGYIMPLADFEQLHHLAREQDITVFSDEVYRESEYDLTDRLPAACDVNDQAVSLGVVSKTYGLPGLRIGWLATHNRAILNQVAALKDYTTICNSAPSEFLAEVGLRQRQALIDRNVGLITRNLAVLDAFFARQTNTFVWQRPKAGPIAFPRLLGEDIEAFCHNLVTQAGVLLLPGTMYNDSGNHFRIGFGRANLPEAVSRLEEYLHRQS